jgi:hypothetical protein
VAAAAAVWSDRTLLKKASRLLYVIEEGATAPALLESVGKAALLP